MRPRILVSLVVVALVVLALLFFGRRRAEPEAPTLTPRAAPAARADSPAPSAAPGRAPSSARAAARARRDELRARIVQALDERARTAAPAPPAQPAAAGSGASDTPRPPGNLVDRTGRGRDALVHRLNTDFMPLAAECIEQAQARVPGLRGMFVVALQTVADDKLGAVVDLADPAKLNEIPDPELFECIRESAFSLSLPPPPEGGREAFDISIPIKP